MKNQVNLNTILTAAVIVIGLLIFFRKPQQTYALPVNKELKSRIRDLKKDVEPRTLRIETVRNEVTRYKTERDTINIIRYQDTLIMIQDTQIVKLTEITKVQDTLITKLEFDNKRLKRQKRWLIASTAVLGTIAIFK